MSDPITEAVVTAAESVPGDLLLLGAAAIEGRPCWSPGAAAALVSASAASTYRLHAEVVGRTWSEAQGLPGAAIAAALRAAVAAVDASRAVNKVSLVWTGPPTRAVGLRSTRAVLKSLVANATESLMLVSYAGYNVEDLAVTLAEAASRGVAVSLVLETRHDSGGGLSVDASAAFAAVGNYAHFYRWPLEAREAFFGSSASLHAKCVIADRAAALITSANLTSAGINDNIELGVLIEAGPLPAKLHDHFEFLVEDGTLVRM